MKRPVKTFDPGDQFETAADLVRTYVADLGFQLFNTPHFQRLSTERQAEAFITGGLTGLIGIAFAMVQDTTEAHDAIEDLFSSYIKQARAQAESILADGETRQ